VVTGDTFEVVGRWMVAVHDNTRAYQPWEKRFFVMKPCDRYDMKERRVLPRERWRRRCARANRGLAMRTVRVAPWGTHPAARP
jgi:hypothetical protein